MTFTWTDEAVEMLRDGFRRGLSAGRVALEIGGVTRNAVIGKASRMGIVKGATTEVMAYGTAKRLLTPRVAIPRPERRTPFRIKPAPVKALPPAPPPPEPNPEPMRASLVSLIDLCAGQCRWIEGAPRGAETLFCGAGITRGAYCAQHAALAYRAPEIRKRRAAA